MYYCWFDRSQYLVHGEPLHMKIEKQMQRNGWTSQLNTSMLKHWNRESLNYVPKNWETTSNFVIVPKKELYGTTKKKKKKPHHPQFTELPKNFQNLGLWRGLALSTIRLFLFIVWYTVILFLLFFCSHHELRLTKHWVSQWMVNLNASLFRMSGKCNVYGKLWFSSWSAWFRISRHCQYLVLFSWHHMKHQRALSLWTRLRKVRHFLSSHVGMAALGIHSWRKIHLPVNNNQIQD